MNARPLLLVLLLVQACAGRHAVSFAVDVSAPGALRLEPHPLTIGVEPFELTAKLQEAKRGVRYKDMMWRINSRSGYVSTLADDISRELTAHLDAAGVAQRVVYLGDDPGAPVDLVLRGSVRRLTGLVQKDAGDPAPLGKVVIGGLLFGAVGAGVGLAMAGAQTGERSDVARWVVADVRLDGVTLRSAAGREVWAGDIHGGVEATARNGELDPYEIADEGLRDAADRLVTRLYEALGIDRDLPPPPPTVPARPSALPPPPTVPERPSAVPPEPPEPSEPGQP